MKKNLLGAIVIFFLTFACLLAMSEASNKNDSKFETQQLYTKN
jgi:hypothetical protein